MTNFRLLVFRGIQGMIWPASIFERHWLCQGINLLKRSALTKLTSCTHFVQLRSVGSGKSAAQSQIGYRRFHFYGYSAILAHIRSVHLLLRWNALRRLRITLATPLTYEKHTLGATQKNQPQRGEIVKTIKPTFVWPEGFFKHQSWLFSPYPILYNDFFSLTKLVSGTLAVHKTRQRRYLYSSGLKIYVENNFVRILLRKNKPNQLFG